jgi:hypothetical protein
VSSINKTTLKTGKIRWQLNYATNGQRRSKLFTSLGAAKDYEIEIAAASKAGIVVPKAGPLTLEQAGEQWLAHCRAEGLADSTLTQFAI